MNEFQTTPELDSLDSELDPNAETTVVEETPTVEVPATNPDLTSALVQKEKYRERFEKAEAERKALEEKLNEQTRRGTVPLAVEDYIDISTSLEGLDAREKAFLAEQHKLSGKALSEIRQGEDFQLWQEAYRQKQEKENALRPNATQAVEDAPRSLADRLRTASLSEKEAILKENNLFKEFRPRADRGSIGNTRSR
jgi:hypothetical protein